LIFVDMKSEIICIVITKTNAVSVHHR